MVMLHPFDLSRFKGFRFPRAVIGYAAWRIIGSLSACGMSKISSPYAGPAFLTGLRDPTRRTNGISTRS